MDLVAEARRQWRAHGWVGPDRGMAAVISLMRAQQIVLGRLEDVVDLPPLEARRRIESLPGVGRWSSAEVAQRALGDPDAVSFGDYHVAKNLTWALTGEVRDDDALAELLEPYRGHRYRVQRLVELSTPMRPRRGPRMAPRTHLPTRR